ncbi:MAG: hypothetical protein II793_03030, partial [Bacteroidales bacterium]|nr:hypothetical protein [Bacteroidales bacterium]
GRLVKEASYSMGVKEGTHVVFNRQGDTAEVTTWHNNHRHGRWWKRIGDRGYITATYQNGGIEGLLVEYNDQGQLVREGKYSGGFKHGANKLYENEQLVVDERWNHGTIIDRRIRLLLPEEQFVSVLDMICLAPQGKNKVVIYLKDGTKLTTRESADAVYDRLGNEFFSYANRKSRILVALQCVQGIDKDAEGRTVLVLDPKPDIEIFPDEDGTKMVQSRMNDLDSPLDKVDK